MNKVNLPENRKGGSATDHLANERTFLAWIRTAIAIMAFGFVVVKFSLFVKQLSLAFTDMEIIIPSKGYSGFIGISMVALGALMSLLAFVRYKSIERHLNNNTFYPSSTLMVLLTILIILGSVFLVLYLLPGM
jgi:putative membrane protein